MKSWFTTGLAASAALLVWGQAATAGEKEDITFTVYTLTPPTVAQMHVTPSGNVHEEFTEVVNMLVSANPLVTGALTYGGKFNLDADGNAVGSGTGVFEVGSWDLSSGMPVFTHSPEMGVWVTQWEFKGSLAGDPYHLKIVAHGVAGKVEGMKFVVEVNQEAGPNNLLVYEASGRLQDPKAEK